MPHSSPIVMKEVIKHFQYFQELIPNSFRNFSDTSHSRSTIYRYLKKLGNGASDAPSESLQRRKGFESVDDLLEVVGQGPYCMSKYLARLLNCWNYTTMGLLKEL